MSALTGPIDHVAVIGGGLTGCSAAAALKRRMPDLKVTLVEPASPSMSMLDHLPCTRPSIHDFHADLGIGDADAVQRTRAAYRLGTLMCGWAAGRPDYVHGYGAHGPALPGGSFHLHWLRAQQQGMAPDFDQLSAGSALARAQRFALPTVTPHDPFGRYGYGLTIDPVAYLAMIRAFADHVGVTVERRGVTTSVLGEHEWIDHLLLEGEGCLRADLYLDCSGPRADLCGTGDTDWEDWRHWLPCDRMIATTAPLCTPPTPRDTVTAWTGGWRWSATTARTINEGVIYESSTTTDAEVLAMLSGEQAAVPIAFAAGTRRQPWRGNRVAIGEAATVIEPLGWSGLHLVHSAIDRLVSMFPDRSCAAIEAADYNRQAYAEALRVRDFVLLHYAIAARAEPFWQRWNDAALPASLAHSLALFRDRARLPFYEHETFDRDEWLAVLIGQGVTPRRIDPLLQSFPAVESARRIERWHAAIVAGVAASPPLAAFLGDQYRAILP